ncbi:MAG: hypothetical protein ACK4N5_16585 [Myxococcales bacterium]
MALERMRIDLDGVELKDPNGRVVCIVRWRTTTGLVLHLPESVDVTVPWDLIDGAPLDLATGRIHLRFKQGAQRNLPWLQSVNELEGEWLDRHLLTAPPKR